MSNKSKKRTPQMSLHRAVDSALVIFIWAYATCFDPTLDKIHELHREIVSVRDSVNCGALTIPQLRKALKDDYDIEVA